MAEQDKKINSTYTTCPNCHGEGKISGEVCFNCYGRQIGLWLDDLFLYWDRKINHLTILQSKVRQTAKAGIDGVLMILGILGIVALVWQIFPIIEVITNSAEIDFKIILNLVLENNLLMLFVWFTFLTDLYLFYRFSRDIERRQKIRKKIYQIEAGHPEAMQGVWPGDKKINRAHLVEISSSFSLDSLKAMEKAYLLAKHFNHNYVEPIHVLAALLPFDKVNVMMARLEVNASSLKEKITKVLSAQEFGKEASLSFNLKQSLIEAYQQAYINRKNKVSVVDLFLALAITDREVGDVLYDLEADIDKIKNISLWIGFNDMLRSDYRKFRSSARFKPRGDLDRAMTAMATPTLNRYSQNLTTMAKFGYFMPTIGREEEIQEIFRIMESGGMRNAILVGEKGVGKTAIIYGIAQAMVSEEVPEILQDKRLVNINVATLIGGAAPDEAQERFLTVLNEVARARNIILVIENIKELAGITTGGEQSLDLLGILAQALSSQSFFCIATSVPQDFSNYIESTSALKGVFQSVDVKEVDHNGAIQILETKAGSIEYKNQVYFSYEAIEKAVELSDRYIHERFLPEKAIGVLEEVAVFVRKAKGKNSLVGGEDVAKIVSDISNVSATEVTQDESEKLLNLEEKIHQRLIGQDDAVKMVASALRRARAEVRSTKRPISNLMFLGPTGVGKTELAKTIAQVYFGDEKNMIRLDMSEYQGSNSMARLLGGAPGVGGFLSESVRKNPFSLVLLDEIEKADPSVLNLFLQVMDDGRLTDNHGRVIDFTNTIIIATSNAGTEYIQTQIRAGVDVETVRQDLMDNQLKGIFRPEFLNRFDGVMVFKPLTIDEVKKIARLMLERVAQDLEKKGIGLEVTDMAVAELAQIGFDSTLGARPLRRVIQEKIRDTLATYILEGRLHRRDVVIFGAGGKINIKKAK